MKNTVIKRNVVMDVHEAHEHIRELERETYALDTSDAAKGQFFVILQSLNDNAISPEDAVQEAENILITAQANQ